MEKHLESFEHLVSRWVKAYKCATLSYLAIKTPTGPKLLHGRLLLEPSCFEFSGADVNCETDLLIACRSQIHAERFNYEQIWSRAKRGEILLANGDSLALETENNLSAYFHSIYHPAISDGPRLPSLQIWGAPRHRFIHFGFEPREVDWDLRACDGPYDSLDELLTCCGLPMQSQMGDSTTLEIVAKPPLMIGSESRIDGERVTIVCHVAEKLDPKLLRLGYRLLVGGNIDRFSVDGSRLTWHQQNDVTIGTWEFTVDGNAIVQAFLSYAGICHHRWWITDPNNRLNPRHAVHEVFDEDLQILTRLLLKPDTDRPYAFEDAISTLLNLLGFSVGNYGRIPKLQKGPDVVGVSDAGNILVVECTVALPDEKNKLGKLVQRTRIIEEKLKSTGFGYLRVQPVIVTPLSRGEVSANIDTAAKYGIAVVCRESLQELLSRLNRPLNSDQLFEEAQTLIPNVDQKLVLE